MKGGMILFKSIHIWIFPVRCPRRMQSSISSQKIPKYKKLSRKRKTAQYLSILSCFMMECRWWDSNPHGFPNDFESFASAIPPHRLIFNFETLVPVSEDWRDVQEGCKKSCFDKLSKFNEYSWISRTDTKKHETDSESFASAIPPHRLIFNFGTLVPVSEDWRDVQEGCKKSCFDKLSKFNEYSWISCTDMKKHEADFESPSSAIPTHRLILFKTER